MADKNIDNEHVQEMLRALRANFSTAENQAKTIPENVPEPVVANRDDSESSERGKFAKTVAGSFVEKAEQEEESLYPAETAKNGEPFDFVDSDNDQREDPLDEEEGGDELEQATFSFAETLKRLESLSLDEEERGDLSEGVHIEPSLSREADEDFAPWEDDSEQEEDYDSARSQFDENIDIGGSAELSAKQMFGGVFAENETETVSNKVFFGSTETTEEEVDATEQIENAEGLSEDREEDFADVWPKRSSVGAASEIHNFYAPQLEEDEDLSPVTSVRKAVTAEEENITRISISGKNGTPIGQKTEAFVYSHYQLRPMMPSEAAQVGDWQEEPKENTHVEETQEDEAEALRAAEEWMAAMNVVATPTSAPKNRSEGAEGILPHSETRDSPVKNDASDPQTDSFFSSFASGGSAVDVAQVAVAEGKKTEEHSGSFFGQKVEKEDKSLTADIPARRSVRLPEGEPITKDENIPTYAAPEEKQQEPVKAEPARRVNRRGQSSFGSVEGEPDMVVGRSDASNRPKVHIGNLENGKNTGRLRLKEYTSKSEAELIRNNFTWERGWRLAGVIALSVLLFGLLFLENAEALFRIKLPYYFSGSELPAVAVLLNLQCLLVAGGITVPDFAYALRALRQGKITAALTGTVPLLFAIIYDFILLGTGAVNPTFFAAPAVGYLLALHAGELIRLCTSWDAFDFCASPGDKLALCTMSPDLVKEERKKLELSLDSRITRVRRTIFVDGCLRRTARPEGEKYQQIAQIVAMFVTAIGMCIVAIAGNSDQIALYITVGAMFASCICLTVPRILTVFRASRMALADDCMIAGEGSVMEYAATEAICLEDIMAFSSHDTRFVKIKIVGNADVEHVFSYLAALFDMAGGPLRGVLSEATKELNVPIVNEIVDAAADGFCVRIGEKKFSVGTGAYMERNHVKLAYDSEDERVLADGRYSIMHAAENGVPCARFYVRYRLLPGFEKMVDDLSRRGVRVSVRTFDPNINDLMLHKISHLYRKGVRIVHKRAQEYGDFATQRADSGLVTADAAEDLPGLLLLCKRTRKVIWQQSICAVVGCALGAAAAFGVGICAPQIMCSALVVGMQALFFGCQWLIARLFLRTVPRIKHKREEL